MSAFLSKTCKRVLRGSGLRLTSAALKDVGLDANAVAVDTIRAEVYWSVYTTALLKTAIGVADRRDVLDKLHILLCPDDLRDEDGAELKRHKRIIV